MSRLCVKVVATWEGLQACRKLSGIGIKTLATTLFTMEQAILAAEVGCAWVAPFTHELKAFFDETYDDGGANLELCSQIQQYYERHQYPTKVKAAGLLNMDEARKLAGVASVTVAPDLLRELSKTEMRGENQEDRSIFNDKDTEQQGLERAAESFANEESKYREAFAKRYDGKGAWKTKQAIDIFCEYQDKAETLMRDNDPAKDKGDGKQQQRDADINRRSNWYERLEFRSREIFAAKKGIVPIMFADGFRSSKTFVIFVVCAAIFTDILLQNLVVPVLPFALSERVGLSTDDEIQRWNSILLAAFGGALMFGSSSTLCFALGSNLPVLLVARLLEGLSTAIVNTIGMTLISDAVGPKDIGKAMGYTSMALSSGLLLGPFLGGVLYEYGGYFHVFLPALGLVVVEIILRLMIVEPKISRGSLTAVGNSDEVNTSRASHKTWDREAEPLLVKPKDSRSAFAVLLCSPRFLVAMLSLFVVNSIGCGFDGVLGPYIKDEFDLRATHAAALFLALALPMFLAPISGALTDRYGAKWPAAGGFLIAIPSLILLRLITAGTTMPFLKLVVLLIFVGIAFALAMPPLRVEASKVVEALERKKPGVFGEYGAYSQAYGLINTAIAAGGMVGPLYAGYVRVWLGWAALSLSMGIVSAVMLVLLLLFCGEKSRSNEQSEADSDPQRPSEVI
ncbi:MAG: hypothetical protein Q9166_006941 [cf. Caloplaca sp. 2 TL-2023]